MENHYDIKVLDIQKTLSKLLTTRASLARFGDGEFDLIRGQNIPYQNFNPKLAQQMKEMILSGGNSRLLIGLPDVFEHLERYNNFCNNFYQSVFFPRNKEFLKEIEERHHTYVSTFLSRPYIDLVDKSKSKKYFAGLKKLWDQRDLLIVEGVYSRSGENNDLFANARSIKRIICPPNNAFAKREQIETEIKKYGEGKLVLLMLGPTAKIIVHDLYQIMDEQLIDLGHIDSEYEWMRMGATTKVKIPHKHTAEFNYDDPQVQLLHDPAFDQQVISRIK